MTEQELNAFLSKVRKPRLVDYLDPLGETAQNAFERKLSWARVSQHDPAFAEEARFLLDNAEELRDVLRDELVEDDWVEDASAGSEFSGGPVARRNTLTERERVTTMFGPEDLDEADTQRGTYDPSDLPTRRGAPQEPVRRVEPPRAAGAEALVSFDEDPDDVLTAVGPAAGAAPDEDEIDPFDAPTTVGPPRIPGRNPGPPPPEALPTQPEPVFANDSTSDELSEYIELDVLAEQTAEETIPPELTQARADLLVDGTAQQPAVATPPPAFGRGPEGVGGPPPVSRLPGSSRSSTPAPVLSGRMTDLRQPSRQTQGLVVLVALAMSLLGFVAIGGAVVAFLFIGDDGLFASSDRDESLTIERVEPTAPAEGDEGDGLADVMAEPTAPEPAPEPERAMPRRPERPAPEPPVAAPDPPPAPAPEPAPEPSPAVPAVAAAAPEPAPAPAPEPEPEPEPEAATPAPEPSSPSAELAAENLLSGTTNDGVADAATDIATTSAAPPPAPAPEPTAEGSGTSATPGLFPPPADPDPAAASATPTAEEPAAGTSAPEVVPDQTTALNVTGLWIGAGDNRSFKLIVRSQDGPVFSGLVELQVEDGSWTSRPITGRVEGGTMQFSGGTMAFQGAVTALRASGTYTTEPGGASKSWSVIR